MPAGEIRQTGNSARALAYNRGAGLYQLRVPILHFIGGDGSDALATEQAVPVAQRSLVALQRVKIRTMGLRNQHVQITAPVGWRAKNQIKVINDEKDCANTPQETGGGVGPAIDSNLFGYGWRYRQASVAIGRTIRFSGGRLVANYHRKRLLVPLGGAGDIGSLAAASGVEVDNLALTFRAEGTPHGQRVGGFQQGGLALRVGAVKYRYSRRQFEVNLPEVAEVGKAQSGQVGQRQAPG